MEFIIISTCTVEKNCYMVSGMYQYVSSNILHACEIYCWGGKGFEEGVE